MNEIEIEIIGQDAILRSTDALMKKANDAIKTGLLQVAFLSQAYAQESIIRGAKSGRLYRRGKTVIHRASAPGEAPANDTGRLASAFKASASPLSLEASVTAGTAYAAHLEYGTTKMAARPFLRPAAEKAAEKGAELIAAELGK